MTMFYKDTPGKIDAVNPVAEDADANIGLNARYAFTARGNTVDMIGPSTVIFSSKIGYY